MELFAKLFSSLLVFVYHCFDRIVIHGYLSGLSRPEQVVYFFRDVVGVPVVDKTVLSKRTGEYRGWVEAFARNHKIPMEWAPKGVRKEDYVRPHLRRVERAGQYGVYFIFQSMEQGPTFRCSMPKFPTQDPNHRILRAQRSRYTHYYFYLRDETLGPMVMRVASFFPFQTTYYLNGHSFIEQELNRHKIGFRKNDNAFLSVDDVAALQATADRLTGEVIRERLDYWTLLLGPKFSKRERGAMNLHRFYAVNQIEYCRNFIFKRHFPIHRIFELFERSCEIGLWRLTAQKISEIFGVRVTKKLKGKLNTTLEQIEHGHHIFRAYFKHAFVKQYEKFSIFLRNEICSNNLSDFGLKKGLDHLAAVREKFLSLGGRLKTGQWWTLQNRPTGWNQNKSIYTPCEAPRANIFWRSGRSGFILTSPGRKIRHRRDATGAPTQRPEWLGAATAAPPARQPFWRECDKSQGHGDRVPIKRSSCPYEAAAALVRQLRGPHLSTWPWCSNRSSIALTAATSPSSLPQSSTGRLDVSKVLKRS